MIGKRFLPMGHFQLFSMNLKFSMGHLLSFYTIFDGPFYKLMGPWRMATCLPNHCKIETVLGACELHCFNRNKDRRMQETTAALLYPHRNALAGDNNWTSIQIIIYLFHFWTLANHHWDSWKSFSGFVQPLIQVFVSLTCGTAVKLFWRESLPFKNSDNLDNRFLFH